MGNGRGRDRGWARWLFGVAGPLALGVLLWWVAGRAATVPAAVLEQSRRLLAGDIPHVDFPAAPPVGSAFVHAFESLLPASGSALRGAVVAAELLWVAVASVGILVRGSRVTEVQRFALVLLALSLNVGLWPLATSVVLDGLVVGLSALWLAEEASDPPASMALWIAAWLLAGSAPLFGVGFLVVPLLVLGLAGARRSLVGLWQLPTVLIPPAAYVWWTWPGGWRDLIDLGTLTYRPALASAWGFLSGWQGWVSLASLLATFALAWGLGRGGRRVAAPREEWTVRIQQEATNPKRPSATLLDLLAVGVIVVVLLVAVPVAWLGATQLLDPVGTWTWAAFATFALASVLLVAHDDRATAIRTIAVAALGLLAALDPQIPTPTLLAGAFVVGALLVTWRHAAPASAERLPRVFTVVASAVAAVAVGLAVWARL